MELYQDKEWLKSKYLDEELSIRRISKDINKGYGTIQKWLHKLNISVRSHYEIRQNHCNLSKEAIKWINGELLGDGCLWSTNSYSAHFVYGSKYLEYIQYVSDTLKSFGIRQSGKINKQYHKDMDCYSYKYKSLCYIELSFIRKQWYPEGKKIIPKDIELTPLTCRQWYIGDGSIYHRKIGRPYILLYTCGFSIEDIKWLISQLNKIGIKAGIWKTDNIIHISAYSVEDFLDYIGSCPVNCYQYKWEYKK